MSLEKQQPELVDMARANKVVGQKRSQLAATDFLGYLGKPPIYPFESEDSMKIYQEIADKDSIYTSAEAIRLALSDISRNKSFLRIAIPTYLYESSLPVSNEIDRQRISEAGDWYVQTQEELKLEGIKEEDYRKLVFKYTNSEQGMGAYVRYIAFKGRLLKGLVKDDEDVQLGYKVFSAAERSAGRQKADLFLSAVNSLNQVGLSVDKYLELIYGDDLERIIEKAGDVVNALSRPKTDARYFDVLRSVEDQAKLLIDSDQGKIDPVVWSVGELSRLTGFSEDMLQQYIYISTEGKAGTMSSPQCCYINNVPEFSEKTQQKLQDEEAYKRLKSGLAAAIAIEYSVSEDFLRLVPHEFGHGLDAVLLKLYGDGRESRFYDRVSIGREILPLMMEIRSPVGEYARRMEGVFMPRYAAMVSHEVFLWRQTDLLSKGLIEKKEYYKSIEQSYVETVGEAMGCEVASGRAFTDTISDNFPGLPVSYSLGMPVALALNEFVNTHTVEKNREILKNVALAADRGESVDNVLGMMGTDWKSALELLKTLL